MTVRTVRTVAVAILIGGRRFEKCYLFKKLVYFKIFALYTGVNKLEEISV
jgi:hypothetical protein